MDEQNPLTSELREINANLKKLVSSQSWIHSFVGGLFSGLGSVVGATVVVALLVGIFGRLRVVPVVGMWVTAIVRIVQQNLATH